MDGSPVSGSLSGPGTATSFTPATLYNVGGVSVGCIDWGVAGIYNKYHLATVEVLNVSFQTKKIYSMSEKKK